MSEPKTITSVEELESLVGGKEFSVSRWTPRGFSVEVVIPRERFFAPTPRWRVMCRAVKLFVSAVWRELR